VQSAFDVIVVGSGFGGSVCAARLAEKGMRVLVLERGPWWGPLQREHPDSDRRDLPRGVLGSRKLLRNVRVSRRRRTREWLLNADGMLEFHCFSHLNALTASGVGGGSHVYTSILEKPSSVFFDAFPDEITSKEMQPYYDRVREMLRPAPPPEPAEKVRAFTQALVAAGLPVPDYPALTVVWGENPERPRTVINAAGIEQSTSTGRGDAFVGCDDGSKTTLDLTYIPVAQRYGAQLRPLCEVVATGAAAGGGYWVRYRDHRSAEERIESAPRLVLAAGALNTQRLLFDARDGHRALPRLPATLGSRFSPNGDYVALLWKTALLEDTARGPSVGAIARIIGDGGIERHVMGELGLPLHALPLPGFLRRGLRRSTFLFCMGRDASSGATAFDGAGITTSLGRSFDPALYAAFEEAITRTARHYRPRRTILNFLAGRGAEGLFTVHPLGGCSIGRTERDGFTDHRGQVFGHPGLFVADGSLYPRSPGIAPSMTIAALAERLAALMA
jgi:cholesterol oxidase